MAGKTPAEQEAERMQNIREGIGCPHGRIEPQFCGACWKMEEIKRLQEDALRAEDDGFQA